jgi:Bacterial transcriptional activator domain
LRARHGYRLSPEVTVDFLEARRLVSRIGTDGYHALNEDEKHRLDLVALGPRRASLVAPGSVECVLLPVRRRVRIELARERQSRGDWQGALAISQTMLADDPCEESAHEIAIRAHLLEGNRFAALAQWADYKTALHHELDAEPNPELRKLIEST